MDFKSYIEGIFTDYTVSDELKYNYAGEGTHILIKFLGGGGNFKDSQVIPVQLLAYTKDPEGVSSTLRDFAKTYSGTMFNEDLEWVRQFYDTPVVLTSGQGGGIYHYSQVSLLGTLIVSTNISDIKKVEIDGEEYFTTSRKISYVAKTETEPTGNNRIGETDVISSLIEFQCTMENKANAVSSKIRAIREGNISGNTTFEIKLTMTDNDYVETYSMKLTSHTIDSSNATSPVLALTFAR